MEEKIDIIDFDDLENNTKSDKIELKINFDNDDDLKIIEVPKKNDINSTLNEIDNFMKNQEEIRNNLLDETTKKLSENNKIINEYNQLLKENENIKKEYIKLYKTYKNVLSKLDESKENDLNEEIVALKKENIKTNRKLKMVQSLLHQLIDEYSIYDICEITRLTEEKIKEYLE